MSHMKNTIFTFLILLLFSCEPAQKPNILIIGDSISIGYTPFVVEALAEKATVIHNEGNAQHTGTGLKKIEEWLGDTEWDIVQFNWGLWDLAYRHEDAKTVGNRDKINGKITFTVDEYAKNLDALVTILKENTDAKLIFVTTSYVPKGELGRYVEDAKKYNAAAIEMMEKHAILVNDIYAKSKEIHSLHGTAPDNVHYTKEGSKELAKHIIALLKKHI